MDLHRARRAGGDRERALVRRRLPIFIDANVVDGRRQSRQIERGPESIGIFPPDAARSVGGPIRPDQADGSVGRELGADEGHRCLAKIAAVIRRDTLHLEADLFGRDAERCTGSGTLAAMKQDVIRSCLGMRKGDRLVEVVEIGIDLVELPTGRWVP